MPETDFETNEAAPIMDTDADQAADVNVDSSAFPDVFELAAEAMEDGVQVQPRDGADWFRIDDDAIGCIWWPANRAATARLDHCWVREGRRGEGLGAALVTTLVEKAREAGAEVIDTYCYQPALYASLGFEAGESYEMGTTHMTLEVDTDE
jgi:GNAT superfamily N-acetyltransferase